MPVRAGPEGRWRKFLPLILIVALSAAVFAAGGHRMLTPEAIFSHRTAIVDLVAGHGLVALGAFIALYIGVVALSLPGATLLTITGGLVFGEVVGAAGAVVGATIGAIIIFLIARSALGDFLRRRAGPRLASLAEGFREDAFSYLLFLRLVPLVPFWLVNLAPALFDVRLAPFAGATVIGIIPGALAYAVLGSGLDDVISAQEEAYRSCLAAGQSGCSFDFDIYTVVSPKLLLGFAALGIIALIPVAVRRFRRNKRDA